MTVGDLDTLRHLRHEIDVLVPLDGLMLKGVLSVPKKPKGTVVCVNSSPHNIVAEQLYKRRFSTLLIDLLTPAEAKTGTCDLHGDIGLLADRLSQIAAWIERHDKIGDHPLGLFGASTAAAAALLVAARQPQTIKAIVCCSGRLNLVEKFLKQVEASVLLIVGSNDPEVLKLNEMALAQLNDRSHLEVLPGATHPVEEPEALEQVAELAARWFEKHLYTEEVRYVI